jgi:hypothetical protein
MTLITLYSVLFASVFLLVFLQTSRSILVRSLGLILIITSITGYYIISGFTNVSLLVLLLITPLGVLGFFSDLYSATLRTWFFKVSSYSMMHAIYGSMLCIFFIPWLIFLPAIFRFNLASSILVGTIVGSLVGELRSTPRAKSASRVMKSILGTVVGLYGLTTKILFGMIMINIILIFH